MTENILTWNMTNWITVLTMAALGYIVFLVLARVFGKKLEEKAA